MTGEAAEQAYAWRPAVSGIAEVLHATFHQHRYPLHVHDTWTVLLLETGAVTYSLEGRQQTTDAARLTLLPPGVPHDGRAATAAGFRKRVLYVEPTVLPERLAGAAVDRPAVADPDARSLSRALHDLLAAGDDALGGELAFAMLIDHLLEHLGQPARRQPAEPVVAGRVREHLDAHLIESSTLAATAAAVGASAGHAGRSFTSTFGITPHAYVLSRRIDQARRLLLDGEPIAAVAAQVGFHDQAHLTRHFRRYLGCTPARYRLKHAPGSR